MTPPASLPVPFPLSENNADVTRHDVCRPAEALETLSSPI
jgi:hypothetical protein